MRLLGREDSPDRQPSIQESISVLQEEIARGEAVYTAGELRVLEMKLTEYEQMMRNLLER